MYYTIASTRDYDGMMYVDFDAKGNEYVVAFYNKGRKEATRKTFSRMEDALPVYQRFVEAFITGSYSYEDRKEWLR